MRPTVPTPANRAAASSEPGSKRCRAGGRRATSCRKLGDSGNMTHLHVCECGVYVQVEPRRVRCRRQLAVEIDVDAVQPHIPIVDPDRSGGDVSAQVDLGGAWNVDGEAPGSQSGFEPE